MASHVPWMQRTSSLRILGFGLLAFILFAMWLTWGLFNKSFVTYDDVTLTGAKSGLSLPANADVKLHGQIVGELRKAEVQNGQIKLTLGMYPETIHVVPAGVRAQIVPKTLFGEKFIDLIPPKDSMGGSLKAGDTISNAVVPVEFEKFFNDIYPLLTAVPPEKLATTLTALSNTLEGRGDDLGETLVIANDYLKKLTPETQTAVNDLQKLAAVSDTYNSQMDDFGKLLKNTSKVSRNVVDMRHDLADFFDETTSLSMTLEKLFKGIGKDWATTAHNSRQPLAVANEYSSMFPCLMRGADTFTRKHLDTVFENGTLHIELQIIAPQPTAYNSSERPVVPTEATVESVSLAQPEIHGYNADGSPKGLGTVCDELNAYASGGGPWSHAKPFPVPGDLWKMVGINNSHNNKLGKDADYNRTAAASNLDGPDTLSQRKVLDGMTEGLTGVKRADVPDIASLLISPVVRGAEVTVR